MECDSACVRRCHNVLKALDAPLEGWFCVGVLDHGVDSFTCELCDCKKVRYIHAMRHEHYLANIKVGCICAGHGIHRFGKAEPGFLRSGIKAI